MKQQESNRTASSKEENARRDSNPGRTPGKAEGDPETIREALRNQEKKQKSDR
jgi:hypothetical protein